MEIYEEKIWKTKHGEKIRISNMSTEHIKNCINLLKNKKFISVKSFMFYINSYDNHSDMVQLTMEREFLNKFPNIFIDYFEEELEKRKLK